MLLLALIYFYQLLIITVCDNSTVKTNEKMALRVMQSSEMQPRIVGGEVIDIKIYPFAVSVQRRRGNHLCGGSYIAPKFVLSAAHCLIKLKADGRCCFPFPAQKMVVIAGASNVIDSRVRSVQIELVDKVIPHEKFLRSKMLNDIGLIKLKKPFRIDKYVNFIRLPLFPDQDLFQKYATKPCRVAGWGRHIPGSNIGVGILRHVYVPLIPTDKCPVPGVDTSKHLCAGTVEGGRDACQGDSGGPLVCNGTQVGIVSWGIECALPNLPGVYCRVDEYLDWLKAMIIANDAAPKNVQFYFVLVAILFNLIKYFLS